jgi:hypothetical protein
MIELTLVFLAGFACYPLAAALIRRAIYNAKGRWDAARGFHD